MNRSHRSPCPVACTLDLIGDKWTLLIVRDLMSGKQHYGEFLKSPERIATNILANRLVKLTEAGLVERLPIDDASSREIYQLTEKGHSLRPVLAAIAKWGLEHVDGTEARIKI